MATNLLRQHKRCRHIRKWFQTVGQLTRCDAYAVVLGKINRIATLLRALTNFVIRFYNFTKISHLNLLQRMTKLGFIVRLHIVCQTFMFGH